MNEHQRHVKARQDILKGGSAEKRIFVQMEDLEEKKKRQDEIKADRERKNDKMDALRETRTPWFCPECKKIMKKKLDDKMYRLYNQCFDCQITFENKLRIEGKYEEWEKNKVNSNQKAYLEDLLVSLEEWRNTKIEFQEQVGVQDIEMEKEKWIESQEKTKEMADKAEEFIRKTLKEIE